MLLSPGHSPRQISSPSPSVSSVVPQSDDSPAAFRNPRNQVSVLDEDTYVAAIEKIIERDFFPDIPKLRDRLDWMEAVRSGDPVQIRDVQLKIIEHRTGKSSVSRTEGNTSQTPGSILFTTPADFDRVKTPNFPESDVNVSEKCIDNSVDASMGLDAFFRSYTSEDNASFWKLLEKANKKRKERFGYLIEGETVGVKAIDEDKRSRITDGFGTSDQPPGTLDGWKYTAKNLLMYHPSGSEVALTEEEKSERIKGLSKEINRENTRFCGKVLDSRPKDEESVAVLYNHVSVATPILDRCGIKDAKYDLEELKRISNPFYVESEKRTKDGYSFLRTPSPAPGVDESPFVTWGEIEGTPLRLDDLETPVDIGGGDGTRFDIPLPPSRDVVGHSLSREAARKLRERAKLFQKPPLPSPTRGRSTSPGARTFSPAAQKFMRNAMAKSSCTVDQSLRASYSGFSPSLCTPKSGRSLSRFGRDNSVVHSPSTCSGSSPPW